MFLGTPRTRKGPLSTPEWIVRALNSGKSALADADRRAIPSLRRLVDQWIESGKSNGADEPHKRSALWISPEFPQPALAVAAQLLSRDSNNRAVFLFQSLLDSPARWKLFRCEGCNRYFLRVRTPKRNAAVQGGCFCVDCKGQGGAKRTAMSRGRRKEQLIEHAAKCWPKWKSELGERSKWVAARVNEKAGTLTSITGKWITQHQLEIEARSGRNDATRKN